MLLVRKLQSENKSTAENMTLHMYFKIIKKEICIKNVIQCVSFKQILTSL